MNDVGETIQRLVNAGAALVVRTDPTPVPVAWWRRVHSGRHFYFTPGTDTFCGHAFDFESERVLYDGEAVEFRAKDGALVAYLAPIGEQETDQEAAKALAAEIASWKEEFARDQSLRAYVLAEYTRAG